MENTTEIITILTQQTEVLKSMYAINLLLVGVAAAILVCYVLYKLLRIFY